MAKPLVSDELWELVEPLIPKVERRYRFPLPARPGRGCAATTRSCNSGRSSSSTPPARTMRLKRHAGRSTLTASGSQHERPDELQQGAGGTACAHHRAAQDQQRDKDASAATKARPPPVGRRTHRHCPLRQRPATATEKAVMAVQPKAPTKQPPPRPAKQTVPPVRPAKTVPGKPRSRSRAAPQPLRERSAAGAAAFTVLGVEDI
jgi:hypothetical protein